jgi:hypothetical protein
MAGPSASYSREALVSEDEKNQSIDEVPTGQSFEKTEDQRGEGASIDSAPGAPAEPMIESKEPGEPSYEVGYKRPPKQTRIKPGERRNPGGRPLGSRNIKTIVKESLTKKIAVCRGDKTIRVPMMEAITDTFAVKAAQGDAKAAAVVINLATKAGILDGRNDATENEGREQLVPAAAGGRPSDALVASVDQNLLSKDEKIDLALIAERIDLGGEVIALSGDDIARLKNILNKGRGRNVVPQVGENLEQAA